MITFQKRTQNKEITWITGSTEEGSTGATVICSHKSGTQESTQSKKETGVVAKVKKVPQIEGSPKQPDGTLRTTRN